MVFKMKEICCYVVLFTLILGLSACSKNTSVSKEQTSGQIYLYGEAHGMKKILETELEEWKKHYENEGMRHLFVELSYFTAEYLNLWMQADNDEILDDLYADWTGTSLYNPDVKAFYQDIKSECPETVFHGTDVGHQHDSTGRRFLAYLAENNQQDSEEYKLTIKAIEQGTYYYTHADDVYRENKMVENFIREYDQLDGESIMGIYGSAHTGLDSKDFTDSIPCMANQLHEKYGDIIISEDLSYLAEGSEESQNSEETTYIGPDIEPSRTDTITVNGKEYTASYFGEQNLEGLIEGYTSREYWRLEDAYEDFKDNSLNGSVLPYDNYPMKIEVGQVFVIDYTLTDGSVERTYLRSDGTFWNGMATTVEFSIDDDVKF